MSMLPTCPRCGSFVEHDWPTCKICGFDPHNAATHGTFALPKPPEKRFQAMDLLTAGVTLVFLGLIAFVAYKAGAYFWEHRIAPTTKQYFVTLPH